MTAYDPENQSVRGFHVYVRDLRAKKERWLSYPGTGQTPYTGERALAVMQKFVRKGWDPAHLRSFTSANGIEDLFTVTEMRELFQ